MVEGDRRHVLSKSRRPMNQSTTAAGTTPHQQRNIDYNTIRGERRERGGMCWDRVCEPKIVS